MTHVVVDIATVATRDICLLLDRLGVNVGCISRLPYFCLCLLCIDCAASLHQSVGTHAHSNTARTNQWARMRTVTQPDSFSPTRQIFLTSFESTAPSRYCSLIFSFRLFAWRGERSFSISLQVCGDILFITCSAVPLDRSS